MKNLVTAVVALAIVLTYALVMTIFISFKGTSVEWKAHGRMQHFLVGGAAFLSAVVQSEAMSYGRVFNPWLLIYTCSTFFPCFVLTMIEMVNGLAQQRPTNLFKAGRAVPLLIFGMRYGLVANLTGLFACLDAIMFQTILRKMSKSERLQMFFVKQDCFLTDISKSIQLAFVSCHVIISFAMWYVGMPLRPFNSVWACVLLLVLNYTVNNLVLLGNSVAMLVYEQAKKNVLPTGVRSVVSVTGSLVFATWLLLLGGIVLSY